MPYSVRPTPKTLSFRPNKPHVKIPKHYPFTPIGSQSPQPQKRREGK